MTVGRIKNISNRGEEIEMDKLVPVSDMPKPEWVERMGGFNSFPQPYDASTEADFQTCFACYRPEFIEFRQVRLVELDGSERTYDAHIFWFHQVGFMMVHPASGNPTRYYRIGCQHKYQAATEKQLRDLHIQLNGPCDHVDICTKCGTVQRTDSSD